MSAKNTTLKSQLFFLCWATAFLIELPTSEAPRRNSARIPNFLQHLIPPLCLVLNLCKDRIKMKAQRHMENKFLCTWKQLCKCKCLRTLGHMLSIYSLQSHVSRPGFLNCQNTFFLPHLLYFFNKKKKSLHTEHGRERTLLKILQLMLERAKSFL